MTELLFFALWWKQKLIRPVEAQELPGRLWLSLIAADGAAGRPGWCQVTQWNDASKTWLKHHMTHVCAEAHFPHTPLKQCRYIPMPPKSQCFYACGRFVRRNSSSLTSSSGDWRFQLFHWAWSQLAPWHWCDHGSRWNYSFPMVWPPFPGPLWGGGGASASGIWVRWRTIFIQIFARNPSIHLGMKRVSSWFTVKQKLGISLILWAVTRASFVTPSVSRYFPKWRTLQRLSQPYLLALPGTPTTMSCDFVPVWPLSKSFSIRCLSKRYKCGCVKDRRVCLSTKSIVELFRLCQPNRGLQVNWFTM